VNIVGLVKAGALASIMVAMASRVVLADPLRLAQATPRGTMPPSQIVLIVRSARLLPTSEPALTGSTYMVRAVDPYGTPIRVIIDARYGRILSVHRMAATEPVHPPFGALGMRDRPYRTDDARDDAAGPVPPRSIPLRPPAAPDRSLSAAPVHPPLPKPRAATAAETAKPAPAPDGAPTAQPSSPTAAPADGKQAAKQESFPPVTPLE
jgi:hypothetical protein